MRVGKFRVQNTNSSASQTTTNKQCNTSQVYLELDLESLARDLDFSDFHILVEQDNSGGEEDEDLDLVSPFPTVIQTEAKETPVQVRSVDLPDFTPSAEIDVENPDDIQ